MTNFPFTLIGEAYYSQPGRRRLKAKRLGLFIWQELVNERNSMMKKKNKATPITKYRNAGIAVAVLIIAGLALAASWRTNGNATPSQEDRYELLGGVKSVEKARKRATIKHEKVGYYMDAMTMSFLIKDEEALKELKPGDQIMATLVVTDDGGQWLEKITIITESQR